MEAIAKLQSARLSAQKARLVADQIRGLPVSKATDILSFSSKKAAGLIKKILLSAISNADYAGADVDFLSISGIWVDEGKSYKRMMPRAKGRSNQILKRTCHITIKVAE